MTEITDMGAKITLIQCLGRSRALRHTHIFALNGATLSVYAAPYGATSKIKTNPICSYYSPRNEVREGYTGITLSVRLSVDARAVR